MCCCVMLLLITYIYIYMISRRSITPQHIKYNSKSLDVVQSLYFGSKLPSSGTYKKSETNDAKFQPSNKKIYIIINIYMYIYIFFSLLFWKEIKNKETFAYTCMNIMLGRLISPER